MSSGEIVTIIAAVGLVLVQVITAWRTDAKVQTLKDSTDKGLEVADDKLEKIHVLTNSNLTAVRADLAMANERVAKLEALVARVVDTSTESTHDVEAEMKAFEEEAEPHVHPTTTPPMVPIPEVEAAAPEKTPGEE